MKNNVNFSLYSPDSFCFYAVWFFTVIFFFLPFSKNNFPSLHLHKNFTLMLDKDLRIASAYFGSKFVTVSEMIATVKSFKLC